MSLFDFAAFQQPAQAEGTVQPSIFPHPALPQQVIDEALCIGANDQNSRLIICAYFKKDKPDNARFLSEHYGENGAGFYLDGRQYAIWYNAEGIRIAQGESAQRSSGTLISWEQVAVRIRELLDLGRYMPQSELDRVDGYERQQRAAQLWYLRQDFAEGTADAGYLPTVNAIYGKNHGFPEESAAISDLLGHPEGLQNLRDELEHGLDLVNEPARRGQGLLNPGENVPELRDVRLRKGGDRLHGALDGRDSPAHRVRDRANEVNVHDAVLEQVGEVGGDVFYVEVG